MSEKFVDVLIQNLPTGIDPSTGNVVTISKEYLIQIFQDYDFNKNEDDICIVSEKYRDGIQYAYALIKFNSIDQAIDAIKNENYIRIEDNPIYMKLFDENTSKILYEGTGKLLIKNLSPTIKDEELFDTFLNYGEVIDCTIPSDNGQLYAYGIVQFRNPEDAAKATSELNEAKFNGRKVEISPFFQDKCSNKSDFCKKYHHLIAVSGLNNFNQILFKSTNENKKKESIVSPPITTPLNILSISYSVYSFHSVIIMDNLNAIAIGDNSYHQVNYFKLISFQNWAPIQIRQSNKIRFSEFQSAVCGNNYTLFLCNPSLSYDQPFLGLSCPSQDKNSKIIYNKNLHPISLYGGEFVSAAIDIKGWIIIITNDQAPYVLNLPENKFPIQLACMNDSIVALSSDGLLYEHFLKGTVKKFTLINLLAKEKFSHISGTSCHFLAVAEDGAVYARGNNEYGQLGIESSKKNVAKFTVLRKFTDRKIVAAFAGKFHSLFIDDFGTVWSCGCNQNGELMIDVSEIERIDHPIETSIKQGASFCIAGDGISSVFFYRIPRNMPNAKIQSPELQKLLNNKPLKQSEKLTKPDKKKKQKDNLEKKVTMNKLINDDDDENDRVDHFLNEIKVELKQILEQIEIQNKDFMKMMNQNSTVDNLNAEIDKLLKSNKKK